MMNKKSNPKSTKIKGWVCLTGCLLLYAGAPVPAADSTSVSEEIRVLGTESVGSVVTLGLSDYLGTVLSVDEGGQQRVSSEGNTLMLHALEGKMFGYGARLQYTLFGSDTYSETFKITAHTDLKGDSKVLIGIYSISEPPEAGDRRSGSLGEINRRDATYNGFGADDDQRRYADLFPEGDAPAMFLLTEHDPVDVVVSISAADTWTGYEASQGAWLFYELLEPVDVKVYFTMVPE